MKRVSIVGAGLVGSLLGVLLSRRGYKVDIFEKRTDPREQQDARGRSINLVITSRGLHALKQAGLRENALDLAVSVFGREIHGKDGSTFYQPYGRTGECNYSISRLELNKFLITSAEQAGARVHFEHGIDHIQFADREARFTTPMGAKTAAYDVLFGADGAGSGVRRALCETFPSEFTEKTDWLEADYKELFLPLGKDGEPVLKTDGLHIWPRGALMMMGLSNLDGSFTMTLYMPRTGANSFESVTDKEALKKLFETQFPDAVPLMPEYANDFFHNPQGVLGTVRMNKWVYQDSVALIGDAAHAIVPFFGQGMNAGFEDCTHLLALMEKHGDNWGEILQRYEHDRRDNTRAIADMAIENWHEMKEKVADPKFQLRKKIEGQMEERHPELYKSRYGLITYTLTPYAVTMKAGELQGRFFDELVRDIQTPEQASWERIENFLQSDWKSFVAKNNLSLEHYDP